MVTIADFHNALSEAESEIKFAELWIDSLASTKDEDSVPVFEPRGVVIPAINELRYAAKHVSCAMQEGVTTEEREEQLRRAIRHCIRARLDALRAVVLFFVRDFYRFSNDYRMLDITTEDRERFNSHRKTIWDVLSALSRDRSQSTSEDCDKLKKTIVNLHGVYLDVDKYRGKLNELLAKMDTHDKSSTWQWWVGIILAVALPALTYVLGKCGF
jgi:hypothetical protein